MPNGHTVSNLTKVQNLTDNINVSQPVNLDQTELNIATNFSNINGIMNNTQTSTLKTAVDTNSTQITNLFSQTSGVGTSGLKALITGNTTNITSNAGNIAAHNNKLDGTTSSGLKTIIDNNGTQITNLYSQTSGVGTSGLKTLITGNTTNITANQNALTAIETKTDFLTIGENVNLNNYDDIQTDITSLNTMLQKDGNDTVLKTGTGNKIQFYQGGSQLFNSNEVKNLTDNILISSSVDINTLDTELTGIKNNSLSSTLKTAVDANTTELNNIIIGADVMNYSTGRIGKVSGTTGFSIMNSALNFGVLNDVYAGLKQSNTGKTIINGTPNDPISFRKNNVEEYSSNDLKNLVDNITITSNQNLDDHGTKLSILNGRPQLIALTSINPATHRTHHFGYGNGYNYNGSFTDNTFYYIHSNFKVNFTPLGSIVRYKIKCQIDGFYSNRNIYFAVGSSTASSSIIPSTVTFIKGRNSTWTTRKEIIELYEAGLSTSTSYTRFIFCKEVYVSATNAGGTATAGNTGWVIYGGRNNKNVANQTKFYHENDPSPDNPNDTDNFGALECEVWSSPAGYSTSSSTSANYQYLEY